MLRIIVIKPPIKSQLASFCARPASSWQLSPPQYVTSYASLWSLFWLSASLILTCQQCRLASSLRFRPSFTSHQAFWCVIYLVGLINASQLSWQQRFQAWHSSSLDLHKCLDCRILLLLWALGRPWSASLRHSCSSLGFPKW